MDELSALNSGKKKHWKTRLKAVREIVTKAAADYKKQHGYEFDEKTLKAVINQVAEDMGILKEVC